MASNQATKQPSNQATKATKATKQPSNQATKVNEMASNQATKVNEMASNQAITLQKDVIEFAKQAKNQIAWLKENGFFKGEKPNFAEKCANLGLYPKSAMRPNSILRAIRRKQENVIVREFILTCQDKPEIEGFSVIAMTEKNGKLPAYTSQTWVTAGENGRVFQGPLDLVKGLDILERVFRRELAKQKPETPEKTVDEIAKELREKREKNARDTKEIAELQISNIRETNARLLQKAKSQQSRLNSLLLIVETMSDTITQKRELLRILQSPVE